MSAPDNHYAALGVGRSATQEEIKRAYRRITLESHPDRHPGDEGAARRFRRASSAYEVLGDTARRARYDRELDLRGPMGLDLSRIEEGVRPGEIFDSVFGDFFGTRRQARRRGRDLRYTLTVDLPGAVLGSEHTITFEAQGSCSSCGGSGARPGGRPAETCPRCEGAGEVKEGGLLARRVVCGRCDGTGMVQPDPCTDCSGRGTRREQRSFRVSLPPGTEAGAERRLEGQGEPGRFGGAPGDLRVTVNVRPHPHLRLEGREIRCELPVTLGELALGATVPAPTVDGPVEVKIPAASSTGTRLRLRGKGVPDARGVRGDQIVTLRVETPTLGDPEVEAALERLEAALAAAPESTPDRARLRASLRTPTGDDEPAGSAGPL